MKVSKYIIELLNKNDIKHIFGYIGGYNQDIIDAMYADGKIKFILNYHEQASAFAINAYAALTEIPSVATSSGAPSSCNLIAGIANAYFDSHPCVFLVGSPHSLAVRPNKQIRQNAFEEIDMVHMVSDITKYAVKIEKPEDIKYEIEKAFYIANSGRKGPVLIDIPYNIARTEIDTDTLKGFTAPQIINNPIHMEQVTKLLRSAKKPVILVGGGCNNSKSKHYLRELLQKVKIPVVTSLCGLDVLSHNHPCFIGFIGHYGNRYANLALSNADCIIILGSRLDERQMGGYLSKPADNCKIIRVDIDNAELGRKMPEDISLCSTTEEFLKTLSHQNFDEYNFITWLEIVKKWKERYPSTQTDATDIVANDFLHDISNYLSADTIICADVGQNQMCVAQAIKLDDNRRLLNSAGYGSMGFSLPAAIGAAYAKPNTPIISVNGDAGIQMNIQELQTIKRDNLPVNIVILNNHCLGMIRKTQEKLYDSRFCVSVDGYCAPNFEAIAQAYGIPYLCIKSVADYVKVKDFISDSSPRLIEVELPILMENYPEPGNVMDKQVPLLSEKEINLIKKESHIE